MLIYQRVSVSLALLLFIVDVTGMSTDTFVLRTMWGPQDISWFISPSNYSYKYHSYWSYKPKKLSWGPHIVVLHLFFQYGFEYSVPLFCYLTWWRYLWFMIIMPDIPIEGCVFSLICYLYIYMVNYQRIVIMIIIVWYCWSFHSRIRGHFYIVEPQVPQTI